MGLEDIYEEEEIKSQALGKKTWKLLKLLITKHLQID